MLRVEVRLTKSGKGWFSTHHKWYGKTASGLRGHNLKTTSSFDEVKAAVTQLVESKGCLVSDFICLFMKNSSNSKLCTEIKSTKQMWSLFEKKRAKKADKSSRCITVHLALGRRKNDDAPVDIVYLASSAAFSFSAARNDATHDRDRYTPLPVTLSSSRNATRRKDRRISLLPRGNRVLNKSIRDSSLYQSFRF
jgi:hypothetical protein